MTRRHVVLYGDVNLNIIDGSAIWLVSLAETLSMTDSTVHVVLKAHVSTDRLLTRLSGLPNVIVHPAVTAPEAPAMTSSEAVNRLEDVVSGVDASVLIVRGSNLALACGKSDVLSPRLWSYVTDFSFPATRMPDGQLARLRGIAATSHRLLVQTEESRSFVEAIVPEAAGQCLLMTPTVPDDFFVDLSPTPAEETELRLVYSGKMHPEWRTLEFTELPARLAEHGCPATVTMLGDKIQSRDPEWLAAMHQALEHPADGVHWPGGLSREETLREVAAHDIGLGWRSASLDTSVEISTKMLEYAASGTPPLVNRTPAHEELLGRDYPLFVDDDVDTVITTLLTARDKLSAIRLTAQEAVRPYSSSATARRLEGYFRSTEPDLDAHPPRPARLKVVLAGHDLKFAAELIDILQMRPDIDLRFDRWAALAEHDEAVSREMLEWADVVICEWAGHNAVWYSTHKRPDQRLIVRLHRFELTAPWIDKIDIDRVDALITVSPYYQQLVRESKPWPENRIHCIPNSLNALDLDRPKRAGAEHALAIVGIVPFLKRPDRALNLLDALLEHDSEFVLHIKGRMPWEYPWIWNKPAEREPYLDFFARIGQTPGLTEHVVFAPFSPDMANWLRGIGWVLSPSTLESFHLAPAEGMASGSLPLFWPRDGVEMIFGEDYLFQSTEAMARFVLDTMEDGQAHASRMAAVKAQASSFDVTVLANRWMNHILPPEDARETP